VVGTEVVVPGVVVVVVSRVVVVDVVDVPGSVGGGTHAARTTKTETDTTAIRWRNDA
jgi:hypothetical protein